MLTCVLSLALGLAQAPDQDEAARTLVLLRTPEHALKFEGSGADERSGFLLPLLQAYAELLGWKLAPEPGLEAQLAQAATGLRIAGEIGRDELHPLVQSLARVRGLCFRLAGAGGATQLVVARDAQAFAAPIRIPLEMLPAWTSHPAFVLALELPHASEGSAELCGRLQRLLGKCASRADVVRQDSGALRLTGSAALLAFVVESLREGPQLALGLDAATFPADPNTPAGRAAAVLPGQLQADYPLREQPLALHAGGAPTSELDVVCAYARWSQRALFLVTEETRSSLAQASAGADAPASVPAAWAHEFVSGLLADAGCALTPLPARHPVLLALEKHPQEGAVALDPAGLPAIRLDQLAAVAHLAATRFQTFVRLPKLDEAQRQRIGELESPDKQAPFWITELDEPRVFSVIGTPRAITSAVLALKLLLAAPQPR